MITDAQLKELYFIAEAAFTEIENTSIHKESRRRVTRAISNFRRAVAASKSTKKQKDTTWQEHQNQKNPDLRIQG
jgi:DNA-binding transcriptional regulator GbsR (MarR family)